MVCAAHLGVVVHGGHSVARKKEYIIEKSFPRKKLEYDCPFRSQSQKRRVQVLTKFLEQPGLKG